MRALMLIGSLAMIGSGIFCFANGSAAFISMAFVIGVVFAAMGIIEVFVGTRDDVDVFGNGVNLTTDGIIMFFFGIVILSGQVTDDVTAQMLLALWILIEALIGAGGVHDFFDRDRVDDVGMVLGVAMFAIAMYTFFNTRLLNVNAIILVGIIVMLLGLRRFRLSFDIEYSRPGFLTSNEEKLKEAKNAERLALAKAKEGIKEQKDAQRRIEKIKEEITQERNILTETTLRKQAQEEEKQLEEQQ